MSRVLVLIVALLGLAALPLASGGSAPSLAQQATPPAPQIVIASEVLGHATPQVVDNPELSLARVTIMPGAVIPIHHHPGTQIGVVVQGTLIYTVYTGEVAWRQVSAPRDESRSIQAGETVLVHVGDALIESPESIHQGRNEGDIPVVIYLSALFPAGSPRSIGDMATPTS